MIWIWTCISTFTRVHQGPHFWSSYFTQLYAKLCSPMWPCVSVLLTLLLAQNLGPKEYMHQYMYGWPSLLPTSALHTVNSCAQACVTLFCTICSSHPSAGLTPGLECVHVSVNVCMSTWLPCLLHSLCIVACKPVHPSVTLCFPYVSQLTVILSHTLVRMCTYISAFMHIHLTLHICSKPST